jgi:hypothetical protein
MAQMRDFLSSLPFSKIARWMRGNPWRTAFEGTVTSLQYKRKNIFFEYH